MSESEGSKKNGALKICHVNLMSFSHDRYLAIRTSLCGIYDIITLSETSLHPEKQLCFDLDLPGYHPILHRDRVDRIRGGVAAYVSTLVCPERREDLESPLIEQLGFDARVQNYKVTVFVVYRPPKFPNFFWEDLQACLDQAFDSGSSIIIITGDLNADPRTQDGLLLDNFCTINGLVLHVDEPTTITNTSATILDQFITNMPDKVLFTPLLDNDHCTNDLVLSMYLKFYSKYHTSFKRRVCDYANLNRAFASLDWNSCFVDNDVDKACQKWTDMLLDCAKLYVPNKTVTIRKHDAPCYNTALRQLKRKKDRCHKRAKQSMSTNDWQKFRHARNTCIYYLRNAKANYNSRMVINWHSLLEYLPKYVGNWQNNFLEKQLIQIFHLSWLMTSLLLIQLTNLKFLIIFKQYFNN